MLELGRPGFFLAGALFALVPPLLHLISRRPPERAPLPTARFLTPDPRTRIRVERRPTDLLLLVLRSLFVLLVGLAFAAPVWAPRRSGTATIVALDRGAAMAPAWREAVDTARAILAAAEGPAVLVLFDTAAVRLDPGRATAATLDSLAGAGPGEVGADYAAALRGLRDAALAAVAADSARAWLVTLPRWGAWPRGMAAVREAAWPGALALVEVGWGDGVSPLGGVEGGDGRAIGADDGREARAGGERAGAPTRGRTAAAADGADSTGQGPGAAPRAVVLAPEGQGRFVRAALGALGYVVRALPLGLGAGEAGGEAVPAALTAAEADVVFVLAAGLDAATPVVPAQVADALLAIARAGATVVLAGAPEDSPVAEALPWEGGGVGVAGGGGAAGGGETAARSAAAPGGNGRTAGENPVGESGSPGPTAPGGLFFEPGLVLDGAAERLPGRPREGARVLAAWPDGRAAAAATRIDAGCLVFLATPVEAGALPFSAAYPAALRRLAQGCEPSSAAGGPFGSAGDALPLDAAARHLLRRGRMELDTTHASPETAGTTSSDATPAPVSIAAIAAHVGGAPTGRPLTRWVLAAALILALMETYAAYGRRRAHKPAGGRRGGGGAGGSPTETIAGTHAGSASRAARSSEPAREPAS